MNTPTTMKCPTRPIHVLAVLIFLISAEPITSPAMLSPKAIVVVIASGILLDPSPKTSQNVAVKIVPSKIRPLITNSLRVLDFIFVFIRWLVLFENPLQRFVFITAALFEARPRPPWPKIN